MANVLRFRNTIYYDMQWEAYDNFVARKTDKETLTFLKLPCSNNVGIVLVLQQTHPVYTNLSI